MTSLRTNLSSLMLIALFASPACTSISTLHDARTVPKEKVKHAIAFGSIGAKVTGSSGVTGDYGSTITLPMVEYMLRYGINENFDMGVRTSLWAHGLDGKYRVVDGDFSLSLGAGLQYMSYEVKSSSGSANTSNKVTSTDFIIPVYLNFQVSEIFVIYLVPKVVSRSIKGSGSSSTDSSYTYTGGSFGLSFGKEGTFFLEQTMMNTKEPSTNESVAVTQTSLGLRF